LELPEEFEFAQQALVLSANPEPQGSYVRHEWLYDNDD